MLPTFPKKIDNKVILVAPVLLGIYLAVMYPLHNLILAVISTRLNVSITNDYPILTGFILYISSVPLAVFLNKLLLKRKQSYDEKLIVGLVANCAFNLTVALILYFLDGGLFTPFIVFSILSFFGFVLAALTNVLIDKLETTTKNLT